jgi:hypothetical protein
LRDRDAIVDQREFLIRHADHDRWSRYRASAECEATRPEQKEHSKDHAPAQSHSRAEPRKKSEKLPTRYNSAA